MLHFQVPRRLFKAALSAFPAGTRVALCALTISMLLFIALRAGFRDVRPAVFLLGDSFVGNYRLEPGERMEDLLGQVDPGLHVENWAEPGATPLDFFLQFSRGSLVAGRPQTAVVGLSPSLLRPLQLTRTRPGRRSRSVPFVEPGCEPFGRARAVMQRRAIAEPDSGCMPFRATPSVTAGRQTGAGCVPRSAANTPAAPWPARAAGIGSCPVRASARCEPVRCIPVASCSARALRGAAS